MKYKVADQISQSKKNRIFNYIFRNGKDFIDSLLGGYKKLVPSVSHVLQQNSCGVKKQSKDRLTVFLKCNCIFN